MDTVTLEAKILLGDGILGVLGLMFLINFTYIGWMLTKSSKAKCRTKKIAAGKKQWEAKVEDQEETYIEIQANEFRRRAKVALLTAILEANEVFQLSSSAIQTE